MVHDPEADARQFLALQPVGVVAYFGKLRMSLSHQRVRDAMKLYLPIPSQRRQYDLMYRGSEHYIASPEMEELD